MISYGCTPPPNISGIVETRHVFFGETRKHRNADIHLATNEQEVVGWNEVPKRRFTLTDDTHDKIVSGQNEAHTDNLRVQESVDEGAPRKGRAQSDEEEDSADVNMSTE